MQKCSDVTVQKISCFIFKIFNQFIKQPLFEQMCSKQSFIIFLFWLHFLFLFFEHWLIEPAEN